jgi:hypothetical protein
MDDYKKNTATDLKVIFNGVEYILDVQAEWVPESGGWTSPLCPAHSEDLQIRAIKSARLIDPTHSGLDELKEAATEALDSLPVDRS